MILQVILPTTKNAKMLRNMPEYLREHYLWQKIYLGMVVTGILVAGGAIISIMEGARFEDPPEVSLVKALVALVSSSVATSGLVNLTC